MIFRDGVLPQWEAGWFLQFNGRRFSFSAHSSCLLQLRGYCLKDWRHQDAANSEGGHFQFHFKAGGRFLARQMLLNHHIMFACRLSVGKP